MMQPVKASTPIQPDQRLVSLVMDYVSITQRLFHEAKKPGFSEADWAPLAAMVNVTEFKWVSPGYEELSWPEYLAYLTEWAKTVSWESTLHRVHQSQNSVYLEQEERCAFSDTVDIVGLIAVYDFNEAKKIQRLAIYLQHKPSLGL
jgi:hypothetical protein